MRLLDSVLGDFRTSAVLLHVSVGNMRKHLLVLLDHIFPVQRIFFRAKTLPLLFADAVFFFVVDYAVTVAPLNN